MRKLFVLILLAALASGCIHTKWICQSANCLPKDQATNKCLAQANAAYSSNKQLIWEQCMRGEGYNKYRCEDYEKDSPDCRILHVW